jgi:hypothetical protein
MVGTPQGAFAPGVFAHPTNQCRLCEELPTELAEIPDIATVVRACSRSNAWGPS